jgi:hypothetical protein
MAEQLAHPVMLKALPGALLAFQRFYQESYAICTNTISNKGINTYSKIGSMGY